MAFMKKIEKMQTLKHKNLFVKFMDAVLTGELLKGTIIKLSSMLVL